MTGREKTYIPPYPADGGKGSGSSGWGNSLEIMSDKTFFRLGGFIQREMGIKMPLAKKTMLQTRLRRRLRELGLGSYEEYSEYFFSAKETAREITHMANAVTTKKTEFFRESHHFNILLNVVLPDLARSKDCCGEYEINVWSAACATGEEPYTLAMVLREFAEMRRHFRFSILGTDISPAALEKARRGIYDESRVKPVPPSLRKKYMLRGKDQNKGLIRIAPELRSSVRFSWVNLVADSISVKGPVDVVFCRNVLIYFDRKTQEKVLYSLLEHLRPGGYIFVGHSETLSGFTLPLRPLMLNVYKKNAK